jgi:hypothetical protein
MAQWSVELTVAW